MRPLFRFLRPLRPASRQRGAVLLEVVLFLPLLVAFFLFSAQVWFGFARQEAYSRAASTVAEWAARSGSFTTTDASAVRTLLLETAGVEGQSPYLHIRVLDADSGAVESEVGSTATRAVNGVVTPPASDGWSSALLADILSIPCGRIVEVEVWSHQSLTGNNAIGSLLGAFTPQWGTPLGRAIAIGTAPCS